MMLPIRAVLIVFTAAIGAVAFAEQDSLPQLNDGKVPTNVDELWGSYDPRKEPLDVEVLKEWEDHGIEVRIIRYNVGTFKGERSKVAAYYAIQKDGKKLPGLLHLHGGGQSASLQSVMADAQNGYASISLNWGGNSMSVPASVNPAGIWDGPQTDWGKLDATHAPKRNKVNHFIDNWSPDDFTLDPVPSPRNSNWFLVEIAARRALTFLETQPEVDPSRLGVYGHSMGGRLTTELAGVDSRVKAAVPSCGGSGVIAEVSDDVPLGPKSSLSPLAVATDTTNAYLPRIKCPILWTSPTNDFHGLFDNMAWNWRNIPASLVKYSIPPHYNHRSANPYHVTQLLWFEEHLKGAISLPNTPQVDVVLKNFDGVPTVVVTPDARIQVKNVEIYYSVDPHVLTRFWRSAPSIQSGDKWTASCPIMSVDQPLFVYANVSYDTPEQYRKKAFPPGAGNSPTFILSSKPILIGANQLKNAGVRATDKRDRMIDDGTRGWQDWYLLEWGNPHHWTATTRKLKDSKWRGPNGATLTLEVKCVKEATLAITAEQNEWNAFPGKPGGSYIAVKAIGGSPDWQTVTVTLADMMPTRANQQPLTTWEWLTELSFSSHGTYFKDGQEIRLGDATPAWSTPREFRNLRWEGGTLSESTAVNAKLTEEDQKKGFNEAIQKSLEQEKLDRKDK